MHDGPLERRSGDVISQSREPWSCGGPSAVTKSQLCGSIPCSLSAECKSSALTIVSSSPAISGFVTRSPRYGPMALGSDLIASGRLHISSNASAADCCEGHPDRTLTKTAQSTNKNFKANSYSVQFKTRGYTKTSRSNASEANRVLR